MLHNVTANSETRKRDGATDEPALTQHNNTRLCLQETSAYNPLPSPVPANSPLPGTDMRTTSALKRKSRVLRSSRRCGYRRVRAAEQWEEMEPAAAMAHRRLAHSSSSSISELRGRQQRRDATERTVQTEGQRGEGGEERGEEERWRRLTSFPGLCDQRLSRLEQRLAAPAQLRLPSPQTPRQHAPYHSQYVHTHTH